MKTLQNKIAVITGASAGIGRATALLFAAQGASVVLNARDRSGLDAVADQIGRMCGKAECVAGDARLAETHEELARVALAKFGRLDIAVNNAGGVGPLKPLAEITVPEWQDVIAVNLTSAFLGARHQIPAMLAGDGGALVFVSSFVGTSAGIPGMAAYGASKAGLMGLVKGITADYGQQGIRANALLPGGTDTAMAGTTAQKAWAAQLHALKRIARPDEIAQAALFLAGPMSSFVMGSALFADGGNAAVK